MLSAADKRELETLNKNVDNTQIETLGQVKSVLGCSFRGPFQPELLLWCPYYQLTLLITFGSKLCVGIGYLLGFEQFFCCFTNDTYD